MKRIVSLRKAYAIAYILLLLVCFFHGTPALAVAIAPDESFHFRLVDPIENKSDFRVWRNRYDPGDVLSERMTDYFVRRLKETPFISSSLINRRNASSWTTKGFTRYDAVIQINLEDLQISKRDTFGSRMIWDVVLRMTVYNGSNREQIFDSVIRNRDSRLHILYTDVLENKPIYWEQFEKTDYWRAIRSALDDAYDQLVLGYTGYRMVGQIVAKAERVDGSLSVPKRLADKLYHVTIGRNQTLRQGDVLIVTRASAVRTVDPDHRELHFPQIVGRVRVFFLKDNDAIVEVIKESVDAPIQLGDAVSVPIAGNRNGRSF